MNFLSENVCLRPWSFERVPNKMIRGLDNALIYTSTKEACLAACLNEHRFTCRSVEYNYVTLQCHLSDSDRRTTGQYVQFVDAQGVDYFENLCLKGNNRSDEQSRSRFLKKNVDFQERKLASRRGSIRCLGSAWPTTRLRNTQACIITRTKSFRFRANPLADWPARSRTSSFADPSCIAAHPRDPPITASYSILTIGRFPMVLPLT